MPKTKPTSKISLPLLSGKLKFDKTLLAVIAIVVTIAGGYLLFQGSQAATLPKAIYYSPDNFKKITNALAADGIRGDVICPGYRFNLYGNASYCLQARYGASPGFRMGYYNFTTSRFLSQGSPWVDHGVMPNPVTASGLGAGIATCPDGKNYVANASTVVTAFGNAHFGAILVRNSLGQWVAQPAVYNLAVKKCLRLTGNPQFIIIN